LSGWKTVLGAAALLTATAAWAQGPFDSRQVLPYWQPGKWQVTTFEQTPAAKTPKTANVTRCANKDQIGLPPTLAKCGPKLTPLGPHHARLTFACTSRNGVVAKGDGDYNWTTFDTRVRTYAPGGKLLFDSRVRGKRLGDC
jgi:hypothetical protein